MTDYEFIVLYCAAAGATIGAGVATYELVHNWYRQRQARIRRLDGPEQL